MIVEKNSGWKTVSKCILKPELPYNIFHWEEKYCQPFCWKMETLRDTDADQCESMGRNTSARKNAGISQF